MSGNHKYPLLATTLNAKCLRPKAYGELGLIGENNSNWPPLGTLGNLRSSF
jgi:hypothetical protein